MITLLFLKHSCNPFQVLSATQMPYSVQLKTYLSRLKFGDVVTVAPETQINSGSSSESDGVSSVHSDFIEIDELDTILQATDYM